MSSDWITGFAESLATTEVTGGHTNSHLKTDDGFRRAVTVVKTAKAYNRIFFIGNGGSAGIASHMATDYLKNGDYSALAFNDAPQLTCISNDLGYENVFALPLKKHGKQGDILFAISSSGKSASILKAVATAQGLQMRVVTLSGFSARNPLRVMGHLNFYVPSHRYGYVETAHLAICHAILDAAIDYKLPEDQRVGVGQVGVE